MDWTLSEQPGPALSYSARRYTAPRLAFLRLESGELAIGSGTPDFPLITTVRTPDELWNHIIGLCPPLDNPRAAE